MVANLHQVRNLAKRPATSNDVLLAAIETLYDSANMASHPDVETYKMTLHACREHSQEVPLQGLVIKLLGTDAAKKAPTAIDQWKKVNKTKSSKSESAEKKTEGAATVSTSKPDANQMNPNNIPPWLAFGLGNPFHYPGFSGYSAFPGGYPGRNMRGRGRGRGTGRHCFLCRSTDHMLAACPYNTFKDKTQ